LLSKFDQELFGDRKVLSRLRVGVRQIVRQIIRRIIRQGASP
jgi:hypothetical protein